MAQYSKMELLKRSIMSSLAMDPIQLDPGIKTTTARIQLLYGAWVNMALLPIGLAFGFASVLISQLSASDSEVHVTQEDASWIASVLLLFCPIGCIISGIMTDRYGRRIMLISSQVPMFLGWLYTSYAKTSKDIILGRALTGVGCGMAMGPPRVYCTEISLPNLRGVIGSFPNMAVSIGIILLTGLGTMMHWTNLCFACCVITLINFCSFIMLPETPYFVLLHKSEQEARENLAKFRSRNYDLDTEMEQLIDFKEDNDLRKLSFVENIKVLFNKASCKPFLVVNIYIFIANMAGCFFMLFWSLKLLTIANSSFDPQAGNILLGLTRVFMTGVTSVLLYRIGRRPLALISAVGVTLVCLALGLFLIYNDKPSLVPLISLTLYIVFVTLGYYILPVLTAFELYPLQVRGLLGGVTISISCLAMFASTKSEPLAMEYLGISYTFIVFGVSSLLGIIYIYLYLPETKDLTLQEIEEYYKDIRPTLVSQRRIISMSQMAMSRASISKSRASVEAEQERQKKRDVSEDEDLNSLKSADSKKIHIIFEEPEGDLQASRSRDNIKKDKKKNKSKKSKESQDDDQPSTSKT